MGQTKTEKRSSSVKEFRANVLSSGSNANGKGSTSVSKELNTLQEIHSTTNESLDHKLAAALKIKQMEATGQFSADVINAAKKELGIATDSSGVVQSASPADALAQQAAAETDPEIRERVMNKLIILDTYKQMKGQPPAAIQAVINNLQQSQQTSKKSDEKTEDFKDKLMNKVFDKLLQEPKSELESLKRFQELMKATKEMYPGAEGIDDLLKNIDKYKKAGLVREAATTGEELQMEIEKLKVENSFKIEEKKIEADEQRTKNLTSIASDVIGSALDAAAAAGGGKSKTQIQKGGAHQVKSQTIKNAYQTECAVEGCGSKILVTNADQSRDVKCPGCNSTYHLDADRKELTLLADTPAPTSQPSTA